MAVCSASQPVLAGSARAAYRHVRIVQLVGATPTEVGCWHAPQGYARGREPFHTLTGLFAGGAAGRPPAAAASLLALLCAWHAEPADPVAWADARAPQATAAEALRGCLRAWAADCLLAAPAAERALLLQARACRCLPTGPARAGRPPLPLRAPVCLPSMPAGGQQHGPPLHPQVCALGRYTPASPAWAAAPAAKVMWLISLEEHERARPPGLAGGRPCGRMRAGRSAVRGRGSGRGPRARPAGAGRLTRGAARGVRRRGGSGAAVWGRAAVRSGRGRAGRGGAAGGGRARGGRAPAAGLWP